MTNNKMAQPESEPRLKIAIPSLRRLQLRQSSTQPIPVPQPIIHTVRKRRKGGPKTKTGCQTCKARRKKCDETRPSCIKCTSTGRKCDFLASSVSTSGTASPSTGSNTLSISSRQPSPASPLLPFELTKQDAQFFQYYVDLAHDGFHTAFNSPVWILALQVAHTEPCIRHASLATAILHRLSPFIVANPSDPSFVPIYHSALKHYASSVRLLKERLNSINGRADIETWEVSILAAFLFTSFEVLIGNEAGAHEQNVNGLALTKSALKTYRSHSDQLDLPGNIKDLVLALNKRDIQSSTFGVGYETQVLLEPHLPDFFTSQAQASVSLETIIPNVLAAMRIYGPQWHEDDESALEHIPEDHQTLLDDLKLTLRQWLETYQTFLDSQPPIMAHPKSHSSIQAKINHNTIMIQYLTAYIWIYTPYSTSQLVHDPYFPQFSQITNLAEEILELRPDRRFQYSADNEIIHPLFFVAQKCRDGILRRRATQLLKISGREGVWDGPCVAAAAEWITAQEEDGIAPGLLGSLIPGTERFVEDEYRLRGSYLTVNRLAKTMTFDAKRVGKEGRGSWIRGTLGWGAREQKIVYGETDKLWQIGMLFA